MLYNRLLLSKGGGVLSAFQQAEQSPCATIAIGLGGTGISCLRNLKKQVYSRIQPDDLNSAIPEYSHIKFLAVDSDKGSLRTENSIDSIDEATEYFSITGGDNYDLPTHIEKLSNAPECKWLCIEDKNKGLLGLHYPFTGGIRQIGRLLFIEKSAEFVAKMQSIIYEATRGLPGDADVMVHIFTGMGGGTGSGIFLDVCYLVQKALETLALKGRAITMGYFFLPDVNLINPPIPADSRISQHIKANGYAAMKELDYCMNYRNNHDSWDQEYNGFHIGPVQDTPVKVCHLISARDINMSSLEQGYDYAMNVVSDFVMLFLKKANYSHSFFDASFTVNSYLSDFFKGMMFVPKEAGAAYQYCLLGAANAVVPIKEITTYLSSRLFEEMLKDNHRKPTYQEVEKFAENNGLTYAKLKESILAGTSYKMPTIDLDYRLFMPMGEEDLGTPYELILPGDIIRPYRDCYQSTMIQKITSNSSTMLGEWNVEDIQGNQNSSSIVIGTYFALRELLVETEYGPFYATDLLNGPLVPNLVNYLRGVQKQAENDLKQLREDQTLRMQAVKRARSEFLHGGLFSNKKKNFEAFIVALVNYFTTDSHIKVLEEMTEIVLSTMIKQFISLYDNHFRIYQEVCRNLFDTFHENYQILTNSVFSSTSENSFAIPLIKIEDMQESLDNAVESLKMEVQTKNIHIHLFDLPKVWSKGDEDKICKDVSAYLMNIFSEYTGKTITDYLEIRFKTNDPVTLSNCVYNQIMSPLRDKAAALFWRQPSYPISSACPCGYVSVPDTTAVIIAANRLEAVECGLNTLLSTENDRISFLKCLRGVPMFAYFGITDCEEAYRNHKTVGRHLYEGAERDKRNWFNLPDLVPYSKNESPSSEMKRRADLYDTAIEKGIIRQNPNNPLEYYLIQWPPITDIQKHAKEAIEKKDVSAISKALTEIIKYRTEKTSVKKISIQNDGMPGYEEKVRKDYVVSSKEISNIICEEINKENELNYLVTKLVDTKDDIVGRIISKDNFFNAVYSGIITINLPEIFFVTEMLEVTKKVVLNDSQLESAGNCVPIYQAYLTYLKMPDADRKVIDANTEKRLNNSMEYMDVMQEQCDQLIETFSYRYLRDILQQAQNLPEKIDEITRFLLEFRIGIDYFKTMYGLK